MNTNDLDLNPSMNVNLESNSVDPQKTIGQIKEKGWVVPALITALILSLIATCIFAYRNFHLANEMARLNKQLNEQNLIEDKNTTGEYSDSTSLAEIAQNNNEVVVGTEDWSTYQNSEAEFSIKYPSDWRIVESSSWVGFGPKEIGEDVVWGVTYYDKSSTTISKIKTDIGAQFSTRTQIEEEVVLSNQTATKLITTTDDLPSWYSVNIIVVRDNFIYVIGNGAQSDEELNKVVKGLTSKDYNLSFEDFYKSFE